MPRAYQNRTLPLCPTCGRRVRGDSRRVHDRECQVCGRLFCDPNGSKVTCSPACRSARLRDATTMQMADLERCDLCGRPRLGPGTETHKRTCPVCGRLFCRPYGNGDKLTCSHDCWQSAKVEKSFPLCEICGRRRIKGDTIRHGRRCTVCGTLHCGQGKTCSKVCRYDNVVRYSRANGGYHRGIWMRSSWERKAAKALTKNGVQWQYEPRRFQLSDGTSYTPDFYLPEYNRWLEIKGYMAEESATKIALFLAEYPDHDLVVVERVEYQRLLEGDLSVLL